MERGRIDRIARSVAAGYGTGDRMEMDLVKWSAEKAKAELDKVCSTLGNPSEIVETECRDGSSCDGYISHTSGDCKAILPVSWNDMYEINGMEDQFSGQQENCLSSFIHDNSDAFDAEGVPAGKEEDFLYGPDCPEELYAQWTNYEDEWMGSPDNYLVIEVQFRRTGKDLSFFPATERPPELEWTAGVFVKMYDMHWHDNAKVLFERYHEFKAGDDPKAELSKLIEEAGRSIL